MEFTIFGRTLSFHKTPPVKKEENLTEQIEKAVEKVLEKQPVKYIMGIDPYQPIRIKTLYTPSTRNLIVVYGEDVLQGTIEDESIIEKVKQANSKEEIELLLAKPKREEPVVVEKEPTEAEEKGVVSNYLDIFKGNEDFEVNGDNVYFTGVKSEPIPTIIVANFIEFLTNKNVSQELDEEYEALKKFTMWLLLNPIASSRKDALNFVRKNDIKLTKNGLLICYRKVNKVGEENAELAKFVSESYLKVKKWKKSPNNYTILDDDGIYKLGKADSEDDGSAISQGNLGELYQNLASLKENLFTDNYTRTKEIKLGSIYREDEDKIDLDNTQDCSNGLHVGAKGFGFSGCGDTGVIALVNPMKIRSVPVSYCSKMRVSEMFIVGTMNEEDYDTTIEENQLLDFSEQYAGETLAELEEMLKNKVILPEALTCQENTPLVTVEEVKSVTQKLKERIVLV